MGNTIWLDVPVRQASVLKFGAFCAFTFGIVGGAIAGIALQIGFIGFVVGYGIGYFVGLLFGLIWASRKDYSSLIAEEREEAKRRALKSAELERFLREKASAAKVPGSVKTSLERNVG